MSNRRISEQDVYRFIYDRIDTVSHLEALLQLWISRPRPWTEDELAHRLFVTRESIRKILDDLIRQNLVAVQDGKLSYTYQSKVPEADDMIEAVADLYRRELVHVSRLIHEKSRSGAKQFGEAFRFKNRAD